MTAAKLRFMSKIRSLLVSRRLRLIAPMFISGALMVWLLSRINPAGVIERWQDVNWILLALLIPILIILTSSIRAGRLRVILAAQGLEFPYLWLILLQLKGAFILSFLPGGVSSDIYRSYIIGREADHHLLSVTSVLLERAVGLAALIFVSVGSLLVGVYVLDMPTYANIIKPVVILAVVVLALGLLSLMVIRHHVAGRWELPIPFWNRLQQVSEQLSLLFNNNRALGKLVLLSLGLQLSVVFSYFMVAQAMHLKISILPLLISVPVVELLISIPLSVGGIGVRDAALVFLLLPFGVSAEDAVSLSLLVVFVVTIMGVLSGLSFFVEIPAQLDSPDQRLDGVTESV